MREGQLDPGRLRALLAGRDESLESLQRDARDLLARLFVTVKLALVYDARNDAMSTAFDKLAAAANRVRDTLDATAELQFLADGLYLNRLRVKVDLGGFDQAEYLHAVWAWLGVGEVAVLAPTTARDWLELFTVFQQAVGPGGDRTSLRARAFERIRLRPLETAPATVAVARTSERVRALRAYAAFIVTLDEMLVRLQQRRRVSVARVKRVVQELISVSDGNEDLLLAAAALKRHKLTVAHHLANTTVVAVVIGRRLELGRKPLCELALQAALHDVGRAFTTERDEEAIGACTIQRLVHLAGARDALIPRVVAAREAHRWVRPLRPAAADVLPPGAAGRVVAVAHAFDLLTSPAPHRPALLADEALRVLVAEAGRRYDPEVVKLLANAVGVYPVGSLVALASGEIAVVVQSSVAPGREARPRVKVLRDASGAPGDGALVDLAAERGDARKILRCVGDDEVDLNPPAFLLG